jgi:hypothetical protein
MIRRAGEPFALLVTTDDQRLFLFPVSLLDVAGDLLARVPELVAESGMGVDITALSRAEAWDVDQRVAALRDSARIPFLFRPDDV